MKRLIIISLIFLTVGLSACGQNNPITEFDLYGCWTFERSEDGKRPEKRIFTSCNESDKKLVVSNSKITFLAYNKCEFQAVIQDALCPIIYQIVEGTWTYNSKSGILEINYPKNFKAEFWRKVKEEYPELEISNPRPYKRFRIINLDKNRMEIENKHRMAIANRAISAKLIGLGVFAKSTVLIAIGIEFGN